MLLTKVDCQVLHFLNHDLKHWSGDELNVTLDLHFNQPVKNFFLSFDVSLIDVRNALKFIIY